MKFSSDDILQQDFDRKIRGYDPEQVTEFLTSVAREWDHLVEELKRTRSDYEATARELKEYRRRERSLHDALDMAKQVAEEVRHQAERDAELKIAEAELKAERILAGVENRLVSMREELMGLQERRIRFEAEMRASIEAHQRMLETFSPLEARDDEEREVEVEAGDIEEVRHVTEQMPGAAVETDPGMP